MTLQSSLPKILFYAERTLHLPFLEPIEEYLRTRGVAQTAFSAPEFFAGTTDVPEWGLPDHEIDRLRAQAPFFGEPQDFEPDVTIVADACHFRIPHIRDVINVGHGMICKGAFYTDTPITRRENLSRLLLVPGPWHAKRLKPNVFIPIQVTGFIKSDLLFGPSKQEREAFCRSHRINPANKIVLFAPTYNPELSAIPCVAEGIRKIADSDTVLLIKLHNLTDAKWKEMYRNIAASVPNIHYLEDADYSGMMHAADLMISDVSSIAIEFLLLDKPLILFNNPRMHEFPLYRPEDIEYLTRDAGVQVNSLDGLLQAVTGELAQPGRRSEIRQRYAQALDHGRDGKSARRAAEAIMAWVYGRIQHEEGELDVILLEPEDAGQEDVSADIVDLTAACPQWKLNIQIFGGRDSCVDDRATHVRCGTFLCPELFSSLRKSRSRMTVVLCGGLRLPANWPSLLANHFRWNQGVGAVKALTEPVLAARCMRQLCPSPKAVQDPKVLSYGLLVSASGQSVTADNLPSDCVMIDSSLLRNLPDTLPANTPEGFVIALGLFTAHSGQRTLMAMDCNMYPADPLAKTLRQVKTLRRLGRHAEAAELAQRLTERPKP
jgi:hypothetical protein